jgi:hypothetical protein
MQAKKVNGKHTVTGDVVFVFAAWHVSVLQGFLVDRRRSAVFSTAIRLPLLHARFGFGLRPYSLRVCQVLAFSEVCLGCLWLLGQAAARGAAFLTIAAGDVLCARRRRFFGVFWLARLSVAVAPVSRISTVDEARKK